MTSNRTEDSSESLFASLLEKSQFAVEEAAAKLWEGAPELGADVFTRAAEIAGLRAAMEEAAKRIDGLDEPYKSMGVAALAAARMSSPAAMLAAVANLETLIAQASGKSNAEVALLSDAERREMARRELDKRWQKLKSDIDEELAAKGVDEETRREVAKEIEDVHEISASAKASAVKHEIDEAAQRVAETLGSDRAQEIARDLGQMKLEERKNELEEDVAAGKIDPKKAQRIIDKRAERYGVETIQVNTLSAEQNLVSTDIDNLIQPSPSIGGAGKSAPIGSLQI